MYGLSQEDRPISPDTPSACQAGLVGSSVQYYVKCLGGYIYIKSQTCFLVGKIALVFSTSKPQMEMDGPDSYAILPSTG